MVKLVGCDLTVLSSCLDGNANEKHASGGDECETSAESITRTGAERQCNQLTDMLDSIQSMPNVYIRQWNANILNGDLQCKSAGGRLIKVVLPFI